MTDASLHDPLVELPSMAAWAKWASLAPTMKSSTGRYGEGHKSCFEQPLPLLLFISPLNGWMGPNLPTNLWPGMFGMIIREQESICVTLPSPPVSLPSPSPSHLAEMMGLPVSHPLSSWMGVGSLRALFVTKFPWHRLSLRRSSLCDSLPSLHSAFLSGDVMTSDLSG